MRFNKNILVLINPEKDEQVALDKAIRISARLGNTITALVRQKHAVPHLMATLDNKLRVASDKEIEVSVKISPERDWLEALHSTLDEDEYGLVIKEPHTSRLTDHVFLPEDWKLLRSAQIPVLLVKADNDWDNSSLLLCVDGNPQDRDHNKLNERIVKAGRLISEVGQADIHLFSACPSEMQDVAQQPVSHSALTNGYRESCRGLVSPELVSDSQIHIDSGPAELLIPEFAGQVDAKLVIIGTVARKGLKGVLLGNTAEQILKRVSCDLLVVSPAGR